MSINKILFPTRKEENKSKKSNKQKSEEMEKVEMNENTSNEMEKIIEEIKEEYKKMKTIDFAENNEYQETIDVNCLRAYGNTANLTGKQFDYINALENVITRSNSNLRKLNKYCASAVISVAKKYPNINFNVLANTY